MASFAIVLKAIVKRKREKDLARQKEEEIAKRKREEEALARQKEKEEAKKAAEKRKQEEERQKKIKAIHQEKSKIIQEKYNNLQYQSLNRADYVAQLLILAETTAKCGLDYKMVLSFYTEVITILSDALKEAIDYEKHLSPKKIYCTNGQYIKNIYYYIGHESAKTMSEFVTILDDYLYQLPAQRITKEAEMDFFAGKEEDVIHSLNYSLYMKLSRAKQTNRYAEVTNTTEYLKAHEFYLKCCQVIDDCQYYIKQVLEKINQYRVSVLPMIKGDIGEQSIKQYLMAHTAQWEIINNANIPIVDHKGDSFENDIIIVCTNGIFTLEIKNWSQNLSISKDGTIKKDNEVVFSDKDNPIYQSTMHAAELSKFLYAAISQNDMSSSLDFNNIVHSMIVMTDNKSRINNDSSYVVVRKELIRQEILNHPVCLTLSQVKQIANIIRNNLVKEKKFYEDDVCRMINQQIQYDKTYEMYTILQCVYQLGNGLNDHVHFAHDIFKWPNDPLVIDFDTDKKHRNS